MPIRTIALLLIAGGLLGLLNTAMIASHGAWWSTIFGTALFAACLPTGIALWRGRRRGFQWAKMLLALQTIVVTLNHFTYEFSTFFSLRLMIGNTTRHLGADIGSSSNLHYSAQPLGYVFGVNLVAVLALLYLRKASRAHLQGPGGPSARPIPSTHLKEVMPLRSVKLTRAEDSTA